MVKYRKFQCCSEHQQSNLQFGSVGKRAEAQAKFGTETSASHQCTKFSSGQKLSLSSGCTDDVLDFWKFQEAGPDPEEFRTVASIQPGIARIL